MITSACIQQNKICITVTSDGMENVRKLITTVDPHRAATSLFSGEVTIDYRKEKDGAQTVTMHKNSSEFTYEEVEGLIDRLSRVEHISGDNINANILREASTLLKHSNKIFIPPKNPICHVSISLDTLLIRFLGTTAKEINDCLETIKVHLATINDLEVAMQGPNIGITNYVEHINEFVKSFSSLFLHNIIKLPKNSKQLKPGDLQAQIFSLIIHDIAARELASLENLASCDSSHPMVAYRNASIAARDTFKKIVDNQDIESLDKKSIAALHHGFTYTDIFEDCPPLLLRSFERLYNRMPETISESIRDKGKLP